MKVWKLILQALLGLVVCAAVGLAIGTWIFPGETDLLLTFSGFRISVSGMGACLSLLTILAFADGWIGAGNRSRPDDAGFGRLWNGLGFGLLPGIAVWKIFEQHTALGKGMDVPEGWSVDGWIMADGLWLPDQLEIICALTLFAAVVIWLIIRKVPLPENGELLGVSLAVWCAVRMVTEPFRAEQISLLGESRLVGWLAMIALALVLISWVMRILRQRKNTGYAIACVPVFAVSMVGLILIQNQIIWTGNAAADLVMQICLALLGLKAVLCAGRVSR